MVNDSITHYLVLSTDGSSNTITKGQDSFPQEYPLGNAVENYAKFSENVDRSKIKK